MADCRTRVYILTSHVAKEKKVGRVVAPVKRPIKVGNIPRGAVPSHFVPDAVRTPKKCVSSQGRPEERLLQSPNGRRSMSSNGGVA
jgi:hypothetical protein